MREETNEFEHSLVTFALFAYNQEKYIREAVEGAFAQTYEPLEIILSDDCSTDRTFEIMSEMVEAYNGPHRIKLIRNEQNRGISLHVRHIHEIANGEIIIHAAGDDISYPTRTTKTVQAFSKGDIKPSLVMANAHVIDDSGDIIGVYSKENDYIQEINGDPNDFSSYGAAATYAISRDLVKCFAAPIPEIYGEDRLLLIRAKLKNGYVYSPEFFVKYRISESGVWSSTFILYLSNKELIDRQKRRANDYIYIMYQLLMDLDASDRVDKVKLAENAVQVINGKKIIIDVLRNGFVKGYFSILNAAPDNIDKNELLRLFVIKWFPFVRKIKRIIFKKKQLHPAIKF